MKNSVPNYLQKDRIFSDLIKLNTGKSIDSWSGNSYKGVTFFNVFKTRNYELHDETIYALKHWGTTICEISSKRGVTYFKADYISASTRNFQGRILCALIMQFGNVLKIQYIKSELARKTTDRKTLIFYANGNIDRV